VDDRLLAPGWIFPGSPRRAASVAWILWVLSRAFVLGMTAVYFEGDRATYYAQGAAFWSGQVPYRDVPVEYPPAALALFTALAATGSYPAFRVAFVAAMVLLDAASFALLRGRGPRAQASYAIATALLFPVLYVRFDLLPATATLTACLLLQPIAAPGTPGLTWRRAAAGGACLGLGIASKLYPMLLVPFLLAGARHGARAVHGLAQAGLLASLVVALSFLPPLAIGSGPAVLSFLRYQGERGLQIESSYASVLLVLQGITPLGLFHQRSHQAHDLAGPLADAIAPWTRLVQVVAVLLVTAVASRRQLPLPRAAAAVLAAGLATSNVFSPQFLIWLVPVAALALTGAAADAGDRDRATAWMLVAAAGLTALIFPALYPRLLELRMEAALPLLVRNALLLALAVRLCAPPGYRGRTCQAPSAATSNTCTTRPVQPLPRAGRGL
jgi:hypothetical protein